MSIDVRSLDVNRLALNLSTTLGSQSTLLDAESPTVFVVIGSYLGCVTRWKYRDRQDTTKTG